jgi:phosphoglycerate kinase
MDFKTLDDIDVNGKKVLLRVDFNVPAKGDKITDMSRIERVLPTIKELLQKGAKIAVISHRGRPKGTVAEQESLKICLEPLKQLLNCPITFFASYADSDPALFWQACPAGGLILCENLRFHPGEEANDADFAQQLADLGDIYVNDAFAACHRAHASIAMITKYLPSVAGRLLEEELTALTTHCLPPRAPVVAIIGGAKISSKIHVIENLFLLVNNFIIGGGMANTFMLSCDQKIGASLAEPDLKDEALKIMDKAEQERCGFVLPLDVVVALELSDDADARITTSHGLKENEAIFDIGPMTISLIKQVIDHAKTVIWNGPLGAFEFKPFSNGTFEIAKYIAQRTEKNCLVSITGGGDSVAALNKLGLVDKFTYVSTGGGAFLEWLEGKTLPGVEALEQNKSLNNYEHSIM